MPGSRRPGRPPKILDVLPRVRDGWAKGTYRDTRHAGERRAERVIILPEIYQIVEGGFREPSKDEFKEEWQAWNYAIRGKTIDGRRLRVAVSFDEEGWTLVITAIDLDA